MKTIAVLFTTLLVSGIRTQTTGGPSVPMKTTMMNVLSTVPPSAGAGGMTQTSMGGGPAQTTMGGGPAQTTMGGGPAQTTMGGGVAQTTMGGGPAQTTMGGGPAQTTMGGGPAQTTMGGGPAQTTMGGGPAQTTMGGGPAQTTMGGGPAQTTMGGGPAQTTMGGGPAQTTTGSGMAQTTMFSSTMMSTSQCLNTKADIVFLVDSSSSEGSANFKKQLEFVKSLVDNLNIGPDAVKVGLVTFSDDAHLQFNLNDHLDKTILQLALGFVPYQSGGSDLTAGLAYVKKNSFNASVGGRNDAQDIVVVITDGKADDSRSAYTAALNLKKNGTRIISIGVGPNVSPQELTNIASGVNYLSLVADFDSLGGTLDESFNMLCDAIVGKDPGSDGRVPCEQRAFDLTLLLDTSASEGLTHFQEQTEFAADLVNQFEIGPTKVQVAAATFGSEVYRQFYLNQYDDTKSVVEAIRRIFYSGGATYTQKALAYVRNIFYADGYGHRDGAPKIVLIATDGRSTDKVETIRQASVLRNEGYLVYVVGIGNNLDMQELNAIATDSSRIYTVQSFDDLQNFMPTLKSDLCFEIDQIPPFLPTPDPVAAACGEQPADVVFVLDSSASEGPTNFKKQLYFAGNVTQRLTVSRDRVQVAMVTFSSTAYNVFYLNRFDNKYDVLDAIQQTNYISGNTQTDDALSFVRLNTLSTLYGRRLQAQPVVIVLTDGQSSDPQATKNEAALLRSTGAVVIAIGIGTNTDDAELSAIASDDAHKFNINSFDFLFSIVDQIVTETCEGSLTTREPHPECGDKPADIVFLMDASSSEGAYNFEKMKAFVGDFVSQFVIGPKNVQVSCIAFSSIEHVEFYLNETTDVKQVLTEISNIKFYGGTTQTDKALARARLDVLTTQRGARPGAADTVILLTDGRSNARTETIRQAQMLKDMGVNIITIGVGSSVDSSELESVASDVQHAFSVINFDALKSIEIELVDTACQACTATEAADILIIIDSSSDESAARFKQEMDFVANLVRGFQVGPDNMQFSLMTFATSPNVEFWFNTYQTKQEILDNLQLVFYTKGDTNTHEALKFAREYSYLPFHGTRPDKSQYVIVLTDGKASDINATIAEADLLKQRQVTIMAVGTGAGADTVELNAIATDSSHVFIADSADALDTIHRDITVRTCESIFELKSTTMATPSS